MPVITVEAGILSKEQKKEIVEIMTKQAAAIMGIDKKFITILVKENSMDNIGFGGTWLGTEK